MSDGRGGMRHKRARLTRSADFDRVYRRGRSAASASFVVYAFPAAEEVERADGAEPREVRLGVSVGRRVGGAVQRNRIKRLLREAFWGLADDVPAGQDIVVVARPGAADVAEREGLEGVRRELRDLLVRLGEDQTRSEEA
jgi:ribonuclease P protein component